MSNALLFLSKATNEKKQTNKSQPNDIFVFWLMFAIVIALSDELKQCYSNETKQNTKTKYKKNTKQNQKQNTRLRNFR